MKILMNASALHVAGGRSVGLNFLRALQADPPDHDLVVYAAARRGYEELAGGRITVKLVPDVFQKGYTRPWVDNVWSPRTIAAERPDVLFSMGSVAVETRVPQLVLFHWPYAMYPEQEAWERLGLRDKLTRRIRLVHFRRRIGFATMVAAQTEVARERLMKEYGLENVVVVPNAVSLPAGEGFVPLSESYSIPKDRPVLLCLTRYYPHKNHAVLLRLAKKIRERGGAKYAIVTTVSEGEDPGARRWLRALRAEGLEDVIINLGEVPRDQVPALYAASDALLLPTLLESFSGPFIEAMHFERPVLTSDRDFARTVCGDAAFYFDPNDENDILRTIDEAFENDEAREERLARGRERARSHPSWADVARMYIGHLEDLGRGRARVCDAARGRDDARRA